MEPTLPNKRPGAQEMSSKGHLPSRSWDTLLLLLAAIAVILAVVSLVLVLASRPPADDSVEAGFARDIMVPPAPALQMAQIVPGQTESPTVRTKIGRAHP